jgi:hypothetical protein
MLQLRTCGNKHVNLNVCNLRYLHVLRRILNCSVLWDVTPCTLAGYQLFRDICCCHLQAPEKTVKIWFSFILVRYEPKIYLVSSFECVIPKLNLIEICSLILEVKRAEGYYVHCTTSHLEHSGNMFVLRMISHNKHLFRTTLKTQA